MNNLVIVGASGHGKVIADIAEKVGYTDIVFLDDNPQVESCGIYKVVGGCKSALSYKNADFIVAMSWGISMRSIPKAHRFIITAIPVLWMTAELLSSRSRVPYLV